MAMVVVDDSSLQADSQPKSGGLVWALAADWCCSSFTRWIEWTLEWTLWSWWQHYIVLSLRFNGHFHGEPGLAGVYWSKGWWRWWWQLDYWSYKSCKAPVKITTTNKPTSSYFTGWMTFLSPNQQCQCTEGKISYSMDLLTPSSPGSLPTLVSDH